MVEDDDVREVAEDQEIQDAILSALGDECIEMSELSDQLGKPIQAFFATLCSMRRAGLVDRKLYDPKNPWPEGCMSPPWFRVTVEATP